jgi:hypothetical protein
MSITDWLTTNHYVIPTAIQPVIQYYVDHGMDFVALRLHPGVGVHAMQPVRIRYATSNMVLPLRMVAAGVTDKVGITLWVFGNGRYEPANFGSGQVDPAQVSWDWGTNTSNYRNVFDSTIQALGGRAWLTEFAGSSSLVGPPSRTDADWQLAVGAVASNSITITRLRTNLAANFLDDDLQLQAAANNADVSRTIQATQSTGTPPMPLCADMVLLPRQDAVLRHPGRTLLGALVSVLGLLVTRRRRRATSDT